MSKMKPKSGGNGHPKPGGNGSGNGGGKESKRFKGVIKLDVRDSVPDWEPYPPQKAPAGAPNILFVLYDDTGLAAWSPFGGRINMPTLQKLADQRPDVLAVAYDGALLADPLHDPDRTQPSPQRHGLHHRGRQRIPRRSTAASRTQCATIGQILQDGGWSTFWLGKNHNVAGDRTLAPGASRKQWPLQKGFDRFYGFLGGETNQWYPDLVEDNHFIDQPYTPEEGYHLSKDLADQAIADDPRPEGQQPVEAVVHVVLPGRQPCPAPCAAGVHRQVQGQVRRRLRGLPRVGAAAHDREGHPAEGHPAHAAQPAAGRRGEPGRHRAPVGFAQRRREEAVLAPAGGLRRVLGVHRRPGGPHHRLPREERPARQHDRLLRAPTTARPARAAPTARSTRTSSSTATRTSCPRT